MIDIPFRSKEVSWLRFNARVLQEAQCPDLPLLDRLKFLGIYSSNLDEFFRVRVATLRRLAKLPLDHADLGIPDPSKTLKEVYRILKEESLTFNKVHTEIFRLLAENGVRLVSNRKVPKELVPHLEQFFEDKVLPHLMPITIKSTSRLSGLRDHSMYLAVRMWRKKGAGRNAHALIEIPDALPRFHVLPRVGNEDRVMYLDDIIRFGLEKVFESTSYDNFDSYALKFTRDAEMEFDNDFTESFFEQITEGLKAREVGQAVRVNYDEEMPRGFLRLVLKGLEITGDYDTQFPGARYHNRKDLMKFPGLGRKDLSSTKIEPVVPARLKNVEGNSLLREMRNGDIMLHFPYHSFNHFLDLLRQASIDPLVKSIRLTAISAREEFLRCSGIDQCEAEWERRHGARGADGTL